MTKKLLLGLLLLLSLQAISQDKNWSVEANYPILLGDDYLDEYNGLLDLGLNYRFVRLGVFEIGAGINGGIFQNKNGRNSNIIVDGKAFYIQPRVFTELHLRRFRPSFGIGYSIWNEDIEADLIGDNFEPFDYNDTNGGLNINLGVSFDITKHFFVKAQYDFTRLNIRDTIEQEGEAFDFERNENVDIIKFGVGFRF
ncbi:outer membrane protein [Ulvibacterium marinum]|uniref:outer membrane protein n=1 Tax=Ulvibacterium marinum TaxID=2419782 RepID=UPI00249409E6|nr:outer membrane beta-barrel protein [Ulvibacterium marinum]